MEKIARICWNTNGWKHPSGRYGKSKTKNAYESINGFGHEEWLLDKTIVIDGYHYAFLQPMNKPCHRKDTKIYDIHLYTVTPDNKLAYIGCLRNATSVTPKESEKKYKRYKKEGWLQQMKDEVTDVGGTVNDFTPENLFNVKFKFSEAELYLSNSKILKRETIGKALRYSILMDKKGNFEFEFDKKENTIKTLNTEEYWRTNSLGKTLVTPRHKKMQNAVLKLLKQNYVNLILEDNHVDMKGQPIENTKTWHFFEFKTSSARYSIREAMGQILEYAHYPSNYRAEKLFIIGLDEADENDIAYMKFLRETYHIPLWYRWYSDETGKLSEEI